MLTIIPDKLKKTAPQSEQSIFEAFRGITAREDWVVFHSLKTASGKGSLRAEVDFMVLIPGKGIVLIEAKGATSVKLANGEWHMEGVAESAKNKDPFLQLDGAAGGIRTHLRRDKFELHKIPFARVVWFTKILESEASIDSTGAQFRPHELAWADQLGSIIKVVEKAVNERYQLDRTDRNLNSDPKSFTDEMVKQISASLSAHMQAGVSPERAARMLADQRERATAEQEVLLNMLAKNDAIFFEGEAGTGKTHLLTKLAVRDAKLGRNVLYCCYNELLADDINKKFGAHPQIEVVSFNALLLRLAGVKENKDGEQWFDQELPQKALDKIAKSASLAEYDSICIDEFQDLVSRPKILEAILAIRRNKPRQAHVYLAADDGQQIFTKGELQESWKVAKDALPNLAHVTLSTNVRQPPELSIAIHELLQMPHLHLSHRIETGNPWSLTVLATKEENKLRELSQVLQKLAELYPDAKPRVLSPFRAKSALGEAFTQSDTHSSDERWLKKHAKHDSNPDGEIRWRSISKFKGLEDQIIVITDISQAADDKLAQGGRRLKDQIFVGATRSTQHVVLLVQDDVLPASMSLKSFLK